MAANMPRPVSIPEARRGAFVLWSSRIAGAWIYRFTFGAAAFAGLAGLALLDFGCAKRLAGPGGIETTNIPCENSFNCPAAPNSCMISTCVERYCAMVPAAEKTLTTPQRGGDCAMLVCDGRGGTEYIEDPQDWPADDDNACTEEVCEEGKPQHTPVELGASCGDNGFCNGKGVCGDCLPSKRRCRGNTPEECSEEGKWADSEACPEQSPICVGDASCLRIAGVMVGYRSSCARFADGSLRCWGDRSSGSIGRSGASQVTGLYGVASIAAGKAHTCAVLRDSSAACWGNNADGELGDKTTTQRSAPVPVAGITDVAQIAVGVGFSCARLGSGEVKCWGRNDKGQLGVGTPAKAGPPRAPDASSSDGGPRSGPDLFREVSRPASVSLGETHGCAIVGGSAQCWGSDDFGQLGRGDAQPSPPAKGRPAPASKPPAPVKGLTGAAEIALGDAHACARLEDGAVMCWGDNDAGQLGDGSSAAKTSPVKINDLSGAAALALGRRHSCALLSDGGVRCWGENAAGQIGDGTNDRRAAPAEVTGISGARAIAARGDHTCVTLSSGAIRCWGANGSGQLGDGTSDARTAPVPVRW